MLAIYSLISSNLLKYKYFRILNENHFVKGNRYDVLIRGVCEYQDQKPKYKYFHMVVSKSVVFREVNFVEYVTIEEILKNEK